MIPADNFEQGLFDSLNMLVDILDVIDQLDLPAFILGAVQFSRILIQLVQQISDRPVELCRCTRSNQFFFATFNH